jgi:TolB-like protein
MKVFAISLFLVFSALAQEDNPHIAVLELQGNNIQQGDIAGLSNMLRTELFKTRKFKVIERGQMDEILKEQKFQMSGCTSQECAVEVGQLLGVQYMVTGSVDKVGSTYLADIRMVNVENGEIHNAVNETCMDCRIDMVLVKTMKSVAAKLAGVSAAPPAPGAEKPVRKPAPPPPVPAWEKAGMTEVEYTEYRKSGLSKAKWQEYNASGMQPGEFKEYQASGLGSAEWTEYKASGQDLETWKRENKPSKTWMWVTGGAAAAVGVVAGVLWVTREEEQPGTMNVHNTITVN